MAVVQMAIMGKVKYQVLQDAVGASKFGRESEQFVGVLK